MSQTHWLSTLNFLSELQAFHHTVTQRFTFFGKQTEAVWFNYDVYWTAFASVPVYQSCKEHRCLFPSVCMVLHATEGTSAVRKGLL